MADAGIAQFEKFWLENPLWSPFLVQMEIIQFTGQGSFGVKIEEEKKKSIFFFEILCLPQCQPKIFPTFFVNLSLFLIYHFQLVLGGWIGALHVE